MAKYVFKCITRRNQKNQLSSWSIKIKIIMKNLFRAMLLVPVLTLFSSCEGETGPQGPAGQDGNANVTVITSNSFNWQDVNGDGSVFESMYQVPAINQNVYDNYAILTFIDYAITGGTIQFQLPYILTSPLGYNESIFSGYRVYNNNNNFSLVCTADDGIPTVYSNVTRFKVVLIEGNPGKKNYTWEDIENMPNVEYIFLD